MSFETGDVVRLKSGGPYMTVESKPDGNRIKVVWFSSEGYVCHDELAVACIEYTDGGKA